SQKMPGSVWKALRAAARRTGEPPNVLILSEEAYIPWELAEMPKPLLDDSAPPFFAAQANLGRWAIRKRFEDEEGDGNKERPTLPPPRELSVSAMAVVSGVYDDPDFRPLEQAVQETAELESLYGATRVNADFAQVSKCLKGDPGVEVLHFAVHGIYDPKGIQNGLILTDKQVLRPLYVRGRDLPRTPFVFLNACQVGTGNAILGDYSGLAEAFLYAGACGVIAPLWSVKDETARQIALDFYREIEAGGSPASFIRSERARFKDSPETVSATYLAYQFFGHPRLKLVGLRSQEVEIHE
ncbi:MAG TPA: CHAT domain-containing protein, partial [Thermoanaerobaculia bacterium]|nr:CHAT domain-containing protein [Thermoanaerobaculia bacterium]